MWTKKDLLGIKDLSKEEILTILHKAVQLKSIIDDDNENNKQLEAFKKETSMRKRIPGFDQTRNPFSLHYGVSLLNGE